MTENDKKRFQGMTERDKLRFENEIETIITFQTWQFIFVFLLSRELT